MKKEIDLLKNYPKSKRDIKKRSTSKSDEVRSVARKFGKEFFDGDEMVMVDFPMHQDFGNL